MLFFEIHKVFMYAFAAFPHLASLDARELFSTKYAGVGLGLSAMPTAAHAASVPLMPFCLFAPEAYSGGSQGDFS